jgi:transcriptional regulator with XRE-family HTH domain
MPQREPTEIDRKIGRMITSMRISRGMSRQELGEKITVSHQQIEKYEKARNRISAGRLAAIARVFRVPVSHFFDDTGDEETEGRRITMELVRCFEVLGESDKQIIVRLARQLRGRE